MHEKRSQSTNHNKPVMRGRGERERKQWYGNSRDIFMIINLDKVNYTNHFIPQI